MPTLKFKFASAILNSRIKHGYTQQQVAEATSISVRWYQRIEHGERLPNTIYKKTDQNGYNSAGNSLYYSSNYLPQSNFRLDFGSLRLIQ